MSISLPVSLSPAPSLWPSSAASFATARPAETSARELVGSDVSPPCAAPLPTPAGHVHPLVSSRSPSEDAAMLSASALWWAATLGVCGLLIGTWARRVYQTTLPPWPDQGPRASRSTRIASVGSAGSTAGATVGTRPSVALRWLGALALVVGAAAHFDPYGNRTAPRHVRARQTMRVEVQYEGDRHVDPRVVDARRLAFDDGQLELALWQTVARGPNGCIKSNEEQSACLENFRMAEHASAHQFHAAYAANVVKGALLADAWRHLPRPEVSAASFALHDASVSVTRISMSAPDKSTSRLVLFSCQRSSPAVCELPLRGKAVRQLLMGAAKQATRQGSQTAKLYIEHCTDETPPSYSLSYHLEFSQHDNMMRSSEQRIDIGEWLREKPDCTTSVPLELMQQAMDKDDGQEAVPLPLHFTIPPRPARYQGAA